MYKIVHTAKCAEIANRFAEALEGSQTFEISQVLEDPQSLDDFDCLGLIFDRQEKGVPSDVVSFINDVLGNNDLSELQHMFGICVCEGSPAHALKIVEKLCAGVGCAPSLSISLSPSADISDAIEKIQNGDIELAKGSIGTMFYMKSQGIKAKGKRR